MSHTAGRPWGHPTGGLPGWFPPAGGELWQLCPGPAIATVNGVLEPEAPGLAGPTWSKSAQLLGAKAGSGSPAPVQLLPPGPPCCCLAHPSSSTPLALPGRVAGHVLSVLWAHRGEGAGLRSEPGRAGSGFPSPTSFVSLCPVCGGGCDPKCYKLPRWYRCTRPVLPWCHAKAGRKGLEGALDFSLWGRKCVPDGFHKLRSICPSHSQLPITCPAVSSGAQTPWGWARQERLQGGQFSGPCTVAGAVLCL